MRLSAVLFYSWLKRFKKQGIGMEQCAISAQLFAIDLEDFPQQIRVVQSSYVSIFAYQTKGFAFSPMSYVITDPDVSYLAASAISVP